MNTAHFEKFRSIENTEHKWQGKKLLDWWKRVVGDQATTLQSRSISRDELKRICRDTSYSNLEVVAAILAWGGMRSSNGRILFRQIPAIEATSALVGKMRRGELGSIDAFNEFHKLRLSRQLKGMGAAYFTKLIFFCVPRHDGFIMDQWTSKSVNLISGKTIIDLKKDGTVTDKNGPDTYVEFCDYVKHLACVCNLRDDGKTNGAEQAEIRLFSSGGRKKGEWRRYVVDEWRAA